jgi:hypothetical protein
MKALRHVSTRIPVLLFCLLLPGCHSVHRDYHEEYRRATNYPYGAWIEAERYGHTGHRPYRHKDERHTQNQPRYEQPSLSDCQADRPVAHTPSASKPDSGVDAKQGKWSRSERPSSLNQRQADWPGPHPLSVSKPDSDGNARCGRGSPSVWQMNQPVLHTLP